MDSSRPRLPFIPATARRSFHSHGALTTRSCSPPSTTLIGLPPNRSPGLTARVFLPSGLDLAAALGSGYARSLLKTDLAAYPALAPALDALGRRQPQSAAQTDLYDAWIGALAVQWADDATFPGIRAGHTLECEKDPDRSRFLGHAAPRNRARQRENNR